MLLGSVLRVKLTDGRHIYGTLQCYDHREDLILADAIEQQSTGEHRTVGHIVIPGNFIAGVGKQHL